MEARPEIPEQAVPEVSVVLPTGGRVDLLDRCLDALLRQTFDGRRFEVIVVDDYPRHNTRQLVAVWRASAGERGPSLRYLPNNGAHGPSAVRNLGWRNARAAVVAFTEDDGIPASSWLKNGVDALGSHIDAVLGRVETAPAHALSDYQHARRPEHAELASAAWFCRKTMLEKIGGFDARFQSGWPEDFHFRLIKAHASVARAAHALVVRPVTAAPWGASLWQLKSLVFDALLYKTHPKLYRQKIRATPAWGDQAIAAAMAICLMGAATANAAVGLCGAIAWGVPTVRLCRKRLDRAARSPSHLADIVVTSALLPPLAVFWRLAGAVRFRVRFA
jgi:glycosyltransferase involved in cell wall biosynthesis